MRDHIASIPDDEHIAYFSHGEPRRQHPGVYTGHEDSSGCWVVPDSLELLQHISLFVSPVLHDPVENLTDAQSSPPRRHV